MFRLFRARSTTGLGIDLGTSSVKVVQLESVRGAIALATYASASYENVLLGGKDGNAVGATALLLRAMLDRIGVEKTPVVASLPVLSVFSTVVELPDMPEKDMEAAVTMAARSYVPSPIADVVLGWTRIGPPRTAVPAGLPAALPAAPPEGLPARERRLPPRRLEPPTESQGVVTGHALRASPVARRVQEVFLTAAPRDIVSRYTEVFDQLGVTLGALEVESFPLARSILIGEQRPVLLVDLGDRTTSFSIVEGGYLRLNQAMDLGGSHLTKTIAEKERLPLEVAEERKRQAGMSRRDGDKAASAALKPPLTELIQRGEVLRRLYERKRSRGVARVILIGGGARLPGLPSFWQELTGLPVEVGNPWRNVRCPPVLTERLRSLGPSFAVAVGLALRPFERAG